jgi:hypothetical protein
MTYNVLVLKTDTLPYEHYLNSVVAYFGLHSPGIQVKFTIKQIQTQLSLIEVVARQGFNRLTGQPCTVHYYGLAPYVKEACKAYVKDNQFDTVMIAYDMTKLILPGNGDTQFTSLSHSVPLYPNTGFVELAMSQYDLDKDQVWQKVAHELCHEFCYKIKRKGVPVIDEMDDTIVNGAHVPFYLNDTPGAVNGNFAHTLKNITPYVNLIYMDNTPTVILTRTKDDGKQTVGNLVIDNFKCDTLELPWKNNNKNVSCIPKGTYTVKWTLKLGKFGWIYEVQNVPGRSGILIHSGNYFTDVLGCILLGNGYTDLNADGEQDVLNSKATIKTFNTLMGGKNFILKIQ